MICAADSPRHHEGYRSVHEAVPKCGSFEIRFPHGKPSRCFYWNGVPSRRLRQDILTGEEALEQAKALARAESDSWMITWHPAILLSLMLVACSTDPSLPVPTYAPSPPTQKTIVAIATTAASEAKLAAPLQISAVRQSDHGPGNYFVCLREANPPSDGPQRYYSVFFDNDAYKGLRLSVMIDECEKQTFNPLPATPTEPTVPAPTSSDAQPARHKKANSLIR
jgi:hypothetical protein